MNTLPITAITCTGDRHIQFAVCLKIMERMDPKPAQWIIVDDGILPIDRNILPDWAEYHRRKPLASDPPMSLAKNTLHAFKYIKQPSVAFIEDDDWYPKEYFKTLTDISFGFPVAGARIRRYFQLTKNRCRCFDSNFAITASLLLNSPRAVKVYQTVCEKHWDGIGLDNYFWAAFDGPKLLHECQEAAQVGIKDWQAPGKGPGNPRSHDINPKFGPDPERKFLARWIPAEEMAWYTKEELDKIPVPFVKEVIEDKIGVVIPCYNSAKYLPQLFVSLGNQLLPAAQIIVVDDGSSDADETARVCAEHNVTCYLQPHAGACSARNFGESKLDADINYLFFSDSDLIMYPDAFKNMLYILKMHPEAGYCYPNFKVDGKVVKRGNFDADILKQRNYITMCSLIRRSVFQPMDVKLKRYQDWELWLRLYLEHNVRGVWADHNAFESISRPGRISDSGKEIQEESRAYIRNKHKLPTTGVIFKMACWGISCLLTLLFR